ncbi:Elongation complex protein 6 [Popillia japonica]|uniref:Elongator complex protein 6 n=1 Tax=Popillia japonica TaxID=7064 RepID=A0AAW1JRV7_POPJA
MSNKPLENEHEKGETTTDGNIVSQVIGLDANSYATKKTIAQGLLDVALLTANASQLKYVLQVGESHDFYSLMLGLIITSIALQLIQLTVCIILGSKYNINKDHQQETANTANNVILGINALLVGVNVFISSFEMKENFVNRSTTGNLRLGIFEYNMNTLKTDAQILLQVLNIQEKDKLILIKEDTDSDGNFIIAHALRHILQYENNGVCLTMLQNNLIHYQTVGKRLNYNLQENITSKRAAAIESLTIFVEDIGAAEPKLLNGDTEMVVNKLYKDIENQLQDLLEKCSGLIYVVIDNLSCLLDIGWQLKQCIFLCSSSF